MKKIILVILVIAVSVIANAQEMTAEKYFARGITRDELGSFDEALSDFNEVIKLTPNDPLAWNYRGLVYYHKQDFDKSLADYEHAIKLDPTLEVAWYNKGTLYLFNHKCIEAVDCFNEAIKLKPMMGSYSMRGQAYTELKQYDEAIADFNTAIQLDPTNGYLYSARGTAKYYKSDLTGSCEDFKLAVKNGDSFSQQYIDQLCK